MADPPFPGRPALPSEVEAILLAQQWQDLRTGGQLERGEPDRQEIMRNAARAVHVVGGVLEGVAGGSVRRPGTWLAAMGSRVAALIEAAIPGTFAHIARRHVFTILYTFAALMIALGFFVNFAQGFLTPGVVLLLCVLGLDVLIFLITALMRKGRKRI